MRLFNINGRLQKKSVSKYLINWNKKSRSKVQFKTKKFLEYKCRLFKKIGMYEMEKIKSFQIDDLEDIMIIEKLLKK